MSISRREWIALSASSALAQTAAAEDSLSRVIARHDQRVDQLLQMQITDKSNRWCGIFPDEYGIYFPGSASGVIDAFVAAFLHPRSNHHKNPELPRRIKLAAELLVREQSPDGNTYLPTTNFNSPPDTGFVVRALCPPALLARRAGEREIFGMVEPFLRRSGAALATGGIHTPNHRWVVSAALAQLHELFSEPAYVRRIDQWLAEGIDIDSDGQFSERSTYVYNPITDAAFVTMALKLKRPALLDPARRNLESMMYLIHPGYEVVTEISRRQDLNQRGDMGSYWFSLAHMARIDGDGRFATLARHFAPMRASLSALMEYPELTEPGPDPTPVPDNYGKSYPHNEFVRIRRGPVSATILGGGRSRIFTLRNGDAVINAVRFASAFFGKGQFTASAMHEKDGSYYLTQRLEGPYYQPLERKVSADEWAKVRPERERTEVCNLTQSAAITETAKGFRVHLKSHGTDNVPVAVEINFREGGKLAGVVPAHKARDAWILESGRGVYTMDRDVIRFGPGARTHAWTQIRGAEPRLGGPSVYITGATPFDQVVEFECSTG